MMQIGKFFYPIITLGPFDRAALWTVGCNRHCKGCSNPELQCFDSRKEADVDELVALIESTGAKHVTVSGGEPFLQAAELKKLVQSLTEDGIDDILVYSGYTIEELDGMKSADVNYVLSHITALVDGPFIEELVDDVPLRGSSNQRVFIFGDRYKADYQAFLNGKRRVDIITTDGETHFIGIPFKDYDELYKKYIKEVL